mmetsp:Transcript_36928/g.88230  ORF Transcript_36928/g.88230 Transcript_36928/m.88230 type:complete len:227 (+) Transcript_36928:465-1145(+)
MAELGRLPPGWREHAPDTGLCTQLGSNSDSIWTLYGHPAHRIGSGNPRRQSAGCRDEVEPVLRQAAAAFCLLFHVLCDLGLRMLSQLDCHEQPGEPHLVDWLCLELRGRLFCGHSERYWRAPLDQSHQPRQSHDMDRHNAMLPKRRDGHRPCLFLDPQPGGYQGRLSGKPAKHDGLGGRLQYLDKPHLPGHLRLRPAHGAPRGPPRNTSPGGPRNEEIGGGPPGAA